MTEVRKGQYRGKLSREEFRSRFTDSFFDPAFRAAESEIATLEAIAWDGYSNARKSPVTGKAGPGFADPTYDLPVEWRVARDRIMDANRRQSDSATPRCILVICASPRNDGTCPGEISKSYRMTKLVSEVFEAEDMGVDLLDLSLLTSEYGRVIHPCKGCVSTAMPLCHFPCSCYPNHSLHQVNDWMNEIYERWTAAHGILIITPVHWYQATSPLKLMIDRLVCADGGNPDPTTTLGKDPARAKELELRGWDYPKHLAGRAYGVVVHGDVAGIEGVRRALSDWLDWMGLVPAGADGRLDRFIGYYEPYATSHDIMDADAFVQEEIRNTARALANTVRALRLNVPLQVDRDLKRPRPK